MTELDHVTALAVIGDAALVLRDGRPERAVAVAALTSVIASDTLRFTLASHIVGDPRALRRWISETLAHDPLLVGHRLPRISRLLCGAGLDYAVAASFRADARYDVARRGRRRAVPLAVTALGTGVLAVGEEALAATPSRTRTGHLLATLATIDAVATWALFVRQITGARVPLHRQVIARLAHDLRAGGAADALVASVVPSIH